MMLGSFEQLKGRMKTATERPQLSPLVGQTAKNDCIVSQSCFSSFPEFKMVPSEPL